ncbi:MAG: YkgJ family cysteine cluster protein [Lactococcus garvieae]
MFFFNQNDRRCKIYESRPLICRVDDYFRMVLKDSITIEEYYRINSHYCDIMTNIRKEY